MSYCRKSSVWRVQCNFSMFWRVNVILFSVVNLTCLVSVVKKILIKFLWFQIAHNIFIRVSNVWRINHKINSIKSRQIKHRMTFSGKWTQNHQSRRRYQCRHRGRCWNLFYQRQRWNEDFLYIATSNDKWSERVSTHSKKRASWARQRCHVVLINQHPLSWAEENLCWIRRTSGKWESSEYVWRWSIESETFILR